MDLIKIKAKLIAKNLKKFSRAGFTFYAEENIYEVTQEQLKAIESTVLVDGSRVIEVTVLNVTELEQTGKSLAEQLYEVATATSNSEIDWDNCTKEEQEQWGKVADSQALKAEKLFSIFSDNTQNWTDLSEEIQQAWDAVEKHKRENK